MGLYIPIWVDKPSKVGFINELGVILKNHTTMNVYDELCELIQELQQSSLNCGGIWKVRVIVKTDETENVIDTLIREFKISNKYDNLEKYAEWQKKGGWNPEENKLTKNIGLIPVEDWQSYLSERIDFWSVFELISKEEMLKLFDNAQFRGNKQRFIDLLESILNSTSKLKVYKMNDSSFDTYDLWWHQIQEDVIFDLGKDILILNFGWSS